MTAEKETQEVEQATEREVRLDPEQAKEWGNDIRVAGHTTEEEEESEELEEVDETEETEEVVETHDEPTPVLTVEDPGEYNPKDYSFEIEVDGKKHKISSAEEADTFADENADNLTSKQIIDLIKNGNKLESSLERDKEKYDADKSKFDEQKALSDAQQESITNIANEIGYLTSKGKLPKVEDKYANADWSDPEVAKQDGVKEQVELLTYMRKENDARVKAGLQPLTSAIDAFNALQLEKQGKNDIDKEKGRTAARRDAAGKVAGNSPNPVNIAPKGIAVGRTLSLSDLDSF